MSEKTKYVYFFGAGATEGNAGMKNILGGKGANLAEMASLENMGSHPSKGNAQAARCTVGTSGVVNELEHLGL